MTPLELNVDALTTEPRLLRCRSRDRIPVWRTLPPETSTSSNVQLFRRYTYNTPTRNTQSDPTSLPSLCEDIISYRKWSSPPLWSGKVSSLDSLGSNALEHAFSLECLENIGQGSLYLRLGIHFRTFGGSGSPLQLVFDRGACE